MPVAKCGLSFLIRCEDILDDHDRQQVHQFNYGQKSSGRRVSSTFSNISISIYTQRISTKYSGWPFRWRQRPYQPYHIPFSTAGFGWHTPTTLAEKALISGFNCLMFLPNSVAGSSCSMSNLVFASEPPAMSLFFCHNGWRLCSGREQAVVSVVYHIELGNVCSISPEIWSHDNHKQ